MTTDLKEQGLNRAKIRMLFSIFVRVTKSEWLNVQNSTTKIQQEHFVKKKPAANKCLAEISKHGF